MLDFLKRLQRIAVILPVCLLILASPVMGSIIIPESALAESAALVPPGPAGSAAKTFIYNPARGLWENKYYTYDPVIKVTSPVQPPEYIYNNTTGLWDARIWEYHPVPDAYEQITISVASPPAGAIRHGSPAAKTQPSTARPASGSAGSPVAAAVQSADKSSNDTPAPVGNVPATASSASPLYRDTDANLPAEQTSHLDNVTAIDAENNLISHASSGNALGQDNYSVGDVASGDATAIANVINLLQSNAGLNSGELATFVRDIQGDVNGDLLIDPATLLRPSANPDRQSEVQVTTLSDASITNNIDLTAASGNAVLDNNYQAGNATTGDANAVANVVNLINSVIAANQSFLGVVNIYGNYTGDILVPQDTLNDLLTSNGSVAAGDIAEATQAAADISNSSLETIDNNVDLTAVSGNAVQRNNTTTGDATSGDGLTKLTILNLTGHQVSAANSLLVFVNVLGKWVGVIMDAPAGATAAALTGGAEADDPAAVADNSHAVNDGSNNSTNSSKQSITNNIRTAATSGDASVSNNYRAGNATSGKATASANITNILNSAFSLSNWFGVLFINVFGSWIGNFGTAKPPASVAAATVSDNVSTTAVFSFVPSSNDTEQSGATNGLTRIDRASFASSDNFDDFSQQVSAVLAANDITPQSPRAVSSAEQNIPNNTSIYNLSMLPIALGLSGLAAIGAERVRSARRRAII